MRPFRYHFRYLEIKLYSFSPLQKRRMKTKFSPVLPNSEIMFELRLTFEAGPVIPSSTVGSQEFHTTENGSVGLGTYPLCASQPNRRNKKLAHLSFSRGKYPDCKSLHRNFRNGEFLTVEVETRSVLMVIIRMDLRYPRASDIILPDLQKLSN